MPDRKYNSVVAGMSRMEARAIFREFGKTPRELLDMLLFLKGLNEPGTCHCGAMPIDALGFCGLCREEVSTKDSAPGQPHASRS